jgi:hypothetical protein
MPSRLGLMQAVAKPSTSRVRTAAKAAPVRTGPVWASVKICVEHATTPQVICLNCSKKFSGGATRIRDHITGLGRIEACPCDTETFLSLKDSQMEEVEKSTAGKKQKVAEAEVDAVSEMAMPGIVLHKTIVKQESTQKALSQQGIKASINASTAIDVDDAVAEFFYGCNVPANIANHPLFKKMVTKVKTAPASYKSPDRDRLGGSLLERTTLRLRAEEGETRSAVLEDGGTVVSDGWDDVERNHLINFLVGNAKGMFFDGTIMLSSADAEDAKRVAELICAEIEKTGALTIVQVVTDTCSVMKAAWKIIENTFPWITCTCCGPHVLSLELTDMGKIPEVAAVIKKVGRVLNRFWGRKRWARTKLKEVAAKNHGKKIGLYRAKATRFAGKVREMARMLRLKADLRQVADTAEYAAMKWTLSKKEREEKAAAAAAAGEEQEEEEEDADGQDSIKKILFDDDGFWKPLVHALKVGALRCEDTSLIPYSQSHTTFP